MYLDVLTSIILCVTTVAPVAAATYTVTTTNDSGAGSLRQAIIDANTPGPDTVAFNIPGAGPHVISLASSLPSLTDDETVIDGYTQPGSVPAPLGSGTTRVIRIEVRNSGIYIDNASGCTVRGLAINISPDNYVFISGFSAQSNTIEGNYLGTDASGTAGGGCIFAGVHLRDGTHHNIIGGSDPDSGNVVSAAGGHGIALYGSDYNQNEGEVRRDHLWERSGSAMPITALPAINRGHHTELPSEARPPRKGTSFAITPATGSGASHRAAAPRITTRLSGTLSVWIPAGNAALGNGLSGVRFSEGTGNRLGAPGPGEGNIISGNGSAGVEINTDSNYVQGNYIGTNADGTAALGNTSGIHVNGVSGNMIGGENPGEGNLISGNDEYGVSLNEDSSYTSVRGNWIGLNAFGNAALGNGDHGVSIRGANSVIGGEEKRVGGTSSPATEKRGCRHRRKKRRGQPGCRQQDHGKPRYGRLGAGPALRRQ